MSAEQVQSQSTEIDPGISNTLASEPVAVMRSERRSIHSEGFEVKSVRSPPGEDGETTCPCNAACLEVMGELVPRCCPDVVEV